MPIITPKSLFIKLDKISLSIYMDGKNMSRKARKSTERELADIKDLIKLEGSKISENIK